MDLRHFVASGAFAFALAGSAYSQTTITSRVATGNDDAEEEVATGTMDLGSSDLELINDQTFHLAQFVVIRFAGLNIPVGSVVTSYWTLSPLVRRSPSGPAHTTHRWMPGIPGSAATAAARRCAS